MVLRKLVFATTVLFLILCFLPACGEREEPSPEDIFQPYTEKQKKDFQQQMVSQTEEQIEEYDQKISRLETRRGEISEADRAESTQEMEKLHEKHQAASDRLEEFKAASEDAREEAQSRLEDAMKELEEAYQDALSTLE